jgi:LysM repeat protein
VDRGFLVFLIVAGLSLGAVWAILGRPRDNLSPSRIEEITTLPKTPFLPSNPSLSSFPEEKLLPSSQDLRDTLTPQLPPSPDSDLLLSVKPASIPAVPPRFPKKMDAPNVLSQNLKARDFKTPPETITSTIKETSKQRSQTADHSSPSPLPVRRHIVADGETLPEIAQRYYRDSTLWTFIYRANQERLPSPELLPIGTELVIPPPPQQ